MRRRPGVAADIELAKTPRFTVIGLTHSSPVVRIRAFNAVHYTQRVLHFTRAWFGQAPLRADTRNTITTVIKLAHVCGRARTAAEFTPSAQAITGSLAS